MDESKRKKIWNHIKDTNIYPEYKVKKIFHELDYDVKKRIYKYYVPNEIGGYDPISKEIDISSRKTHLIPNKRKIDTGRYDEKDYLININFIGDVKFTEKQSSDLSFIGLKTDLDQILQSDTDKDVSSRFLTKWFHYRHLNKYIPFIKWEDINYVDDYTTFPAKVNDLLYSDIEFKELFPNEQKPKYFRLSEKMHKYFNQIISAWIFATIELNEEMEEVLDNDGFPIKYVHCGSLNIPILVLGNNSYLFTVSMEDYLSTESSMDQLILVDYFIYNAQVTSEALILLKGKDLKVGVNLPIVVTTAESLSATILHIELNLDRLINFF